MMTKMKWVEDSQEDQAAVVTFNHNTRLVVPFTRPGFFIDDLGLVHRSGAFGGEAAAGIEVRFGPGRRHPHNG